MNTQKYDILFSENNDIIQSNQTYMTIDECDEFTYRFVFQQFINCFKWTWYFDHPTHNNEIMISKFLFLIKTKLKNKLSRDDRFENYLNFAMLINLF